MKSYVYLCFSESINATLVKPEIDTYLEAKKINITARYQDKVNMKSARKEINLSRLFNHILNKGDQLVVYESANLGRSVLGVMEVLLQALDLGVSIHFVRSGRVFLPEKCHDTKFMLNMCKDIGKAFSSRETLDDLSRKANASKKLGRPKGKKNRALKLDAHRTDIMHYLNLKVSRASIAKLIKCHPQTLQDWLQRQRILEKH